MEITSVRTTSFSFRAYSGTLGAGSTPGERGYAASGDTLILSARMEEMVTCSYPSDRAAETISDRFPSVSASGTEENTGVLQNRTAYLEIIRERVSFLLEHMPGTERTSGSARLPGAPYSTDSYYSPEATAARIVDFALSFYDGGDREEYAVMVRNAVMEGYRQAGAAWGGSLPGTADRTVSLVMDALGKFVTSGTM